MEVHKITLMVIDFDQLGATEVASTIENTSYPNRCISPTVVASETQDIGEWDDAHPLNHSGEDKAEFARLFPAGQWQTIETAPKDGTVILGFWHSDTAELHSKYAMLMWMDFAWFDPEGIHEYTAPSVWMPRPPPPKE